MPIPSLQVNSIAELFQCPILTIAGAGFLDPLTSLENGGEIDTVEAMNQISNLKSQISAHRIDHVAIDITDVERSKAFYGGLLGLTEIPRPVSFTFGGAWYQIGPDVLHLVSRPESIPEAPHHFCLMVADVHAWAKIIAVAGFAVQWDSRYKIPGIDRFFTRDPDGNRVEFQGKETQSPVDIINKG